MDLKGIYGRESSATRESSALLNHPQRVGSSNSRKYLMPNEILRNVRASNQSLDPLAMPPPYKQNRAISNHRNDMYAKERLLAASRADKSQMNHI